MHNFVWLRKIEWPKALLSALIYTIVTLLVRQIEVMWTIEYYKMPQYFGVWSKLMMPTAGPPPLEFLITSLIMTFVSGLCLAMMYYYVRDMLPKKFLPRVFYFADLLIAASFVFFTLPTYLMFNVPVGLLVSWFITGFAITVAASFTFVKLLR